MSTLGVLSLHTPAETCTVENAVPIEIPNWQVCKVMITGVVIVQVNPAVVPTFTPPDSVPLIAAPVPQALTVASGGLCH
jgi:hypothetical protein